MADADTLRDRRDARTPTTPPPAPAASEDASVMSLVDHLSELRTRIVRSILAIVAGGLVGFGTQLGNGFTSGHGVCGIGRCSPRSFVATATFMMTGFATVFVVRHVLGGG